MLRFLRRKDPARNAAAALYAAIAAQARAPVFHTRFAVPDTLDGRFDLFTLHAFLAMDALKDRGASGKTTSTRLADLVFAGFEDALRELGVGDMGIARRLKAMGDAFYGRLAAYDAAGESEEVLAQALVRNLYRGDKERKGAAFALACYALSARRQLGETLGLTEGRADFGPPPADGPVP